ncbi:pyridine nucleotide-disulfide oxidoreductase [Robertmurraya siralis]|uniref:Pyridine nucleotide-disulfide oxidoreductase n=1 Tax=Robertmurraya siralis TaxID=77777 RepID=A0A919WF93_9BACI|nr:NAD(P)/FAD-dependent oxidoreductase [Robertmurraya siralis]GIN60820.1 pyridine nucleotide-disulfide oxidoreductase [Robertmurraya siralis]
MNSNFDVGIIGGGPAGLNAALVLGRARRKVVIIDEGRPRNRVTKESHGFLTRDGIAPNEFRNIARDQLRNYPSIQFVEDIAKEITGRDGEFLISTEEGAVYKTKKILFAVGMKDLPLDIDGLSEAYGRSAFVCPYCDGWELREQSLVLIAKGDRGFHGVKTLLGWTNSLTICTNGPDEWTDEQRGEIELRGIKIYSAPIKKIESKDGFVQQIKLADGTLIPCTGVFFTPKLTIGSKLPQSLGCEMNEAGSIVVDSFGKTNVPGVYSAGDAASEMYQVIAAAASGAITAIRINSELLEETWGNIEKINRI